MHTHYEKSCEKSGRLTKLEKALKTIRPSSVESDRIFTQFLKLDYARKYFTLKDGLR